MARRLPDIPLQTWVDNQVEAFHRSTSGYVDASEFDEGARKVEQTIPLDFPLEGGQDQWEEAERKNTEDRLRLQQQQEEEAQRKQREQREEELRQQQQQEEQRRQTLAMQQASDAGIASPGEAFADFEKAQEGPDHTSSSGVLDAAPTSSPTSQSQSASPVDQFLSWAGGLAAPWLGSSDTTPASGQEPTVPTSSPEPSTEPAPDHTSTTGIFGSIDQGLQNLSQNMHEGADRLGTAVSENPLYQTAVQGGMPDVVNIVRKGEEGARYAFNTYGEGKGQADDARIRELQAEAAGSDTSNRAYLGLDVDPAWEQANPEKAAELERLKNERTMTFGAMAGAGGGGGMAEDAISAIKSLRSAGLGEAAANAERELAQRTSLTLEEIQNRTGFLTKAPPPASPEAPQANTIEQASEMLGNLGSGMGRSIREADLRQAENRMARVRAQRGMEGPEYDEQVANTELGRQIQQYRDDLAAYDRGEIPSARPTTAPEAPATTLPEGQIATPEAPTGAPEGIAPPGTPSAATPPIEPTRLPRARDVQNVDPALVQSAGEDFQRVLSNRQAVNAGQIPRAPDEKDVNQVLNGLSNIKEQTSDRRAKLAALENHVRKLNGGYLPPELQLWARSRVYEGRADVAFERAQRVVQPALSRVDRNDLDLVDSVLEQLDNIDVDRATRRNEQNRVLSRVPEGKAPANEIRREGEATLEQQRAQSNMRATEKGYVDAVNERDALLQQMETLGEGPTQGVENAYQRRKRAERGYGPSRRMETDRSMTMQERLEKANIRVLTAEARRDDARRIVQQHVEQSGIRNADRVMERGATRAETLASERKYSGGATPQDRNAIVRHLVEAVGPDRTDRIMEGVEALYNLRDLSRQRYLESGLWNEEQARSLAANFPHYSPTRILDHMDENALERLPIGSPSFSISGMGMKKLSAKGTEKLRESPTRAIIDMAFQAEAQAQRNTIMRVMRSWADIPGMDTFVRTIKQGEQPGKGWIAKSVVEDGKVQRLAIRQELEKSLELGAAHTGIVGNILHSLSYPLKAGATGLRPAFIFTNAINDAALTLYRFAAESGKNPIEAIRGVTDLMHGYHASFGNANLATRAATGAFIGAGTEAVSDDPNRDRTDWWKRVGTAGLAGAAAGAALRNTQGQRDMIARFRQSGASQGMPTRFQNPADIVKQLQGQHFVVRTLNSERDLGSLAKNTGSVLSDVLGLAWSRPLGKVGNIVEQAPRYAAFARAERQGKSQLEAAQAARRVTVDFAAGGLLTKQANAIMPFLNASTQALVEGADITKKHPVQSAAITAGIVAALVRAEIYNRAVAPEDYKDVSQYTRDTGLVLMSDKPAEGEGKRGLLYIPLRGVVGAAVPLVRAVMGQYFGDDPRTWKQLAIDTGIATANQLSPINADAGGLLRAFAPPLAGQAFEYASNYDSFRGQPIVSRSMEGLPVTEQYNDRTSLAMRHLGRLIGESPTKLDWLVRSTSPGPGESLLAGVDWALKTSGHDLPTTEANVPTGARDTPIVGSIAGRVLRTTGSERQNRAYQVADDIAAKNETFLVNTLEQSPEYRNSTPDRQKQMMRSLQTALRDQAETIAGVPDYKKPRNLGIPARFYGVPAGSALEEEIAAAMASSPEDRTDRQQDLIWEYKYQKNPEYTEATKDDTAEGKRIRDLVKRTAVR
jgi:hypothetical protein